MLKLEDIKIDAQVRGIQGDEIVRIVQVALIGEDALTVYYKDSQGAVSEQMLFRSDEARLELALAGRPWSFDAPGAEFKLGLEAFRITQAALFDPMMAVHTSNVDPYPHQISAVYEHMLPKQPLRFVLADDPGAGKTIMAGLLIRKFIIAFRNCKIIRQDHAFDDWLCEVVWPFFRDDEYVYPSPIARLISYGLDQKYIFEISNVYMTDESKGS
jgi:hypothetical protein